jgi:hypothetical protein
MGPFTKREVTIGVVFMALMGVATYFVKAVDAAPNVAALIILGVAVASGIVGVPYTGRDRDAHR